VCILRQEINTLAIGKDDKKEGWGKCVDKRNGRIYFTEFKNNQQDGFSEYYNNKNGLTHNSYMKDYKFIKEEAIIITSSEYTLSGIFTITNKSLTGLAKINYRNGDIYEGETMNTMKHGHGLLLKNISEGCYCKCFCRYENNKKDGLCVALRNDGEYTIGRYAKDEKEGGFLTCMRGQARFNLFICGFIAKTEYNKEKILNYISLAYPEYKWLFKIDNKSLALLLNEIAFD